MRRFKGNIRPVFGFFILFLFNYFDYKKASDLPFGFDFIPIVISHSIMINDNWRQTQGFPCHPFPLAHTITNDLNTGETALLLTCSCLHRENLSWPPDRVGDWFCWTFRSRRPRLFASISSKKRARWRGQPMADRTNEVQAITIHWFSNILTWLASGRDKVWHSWSCEACWFGDAWRFQFGCHLLSGDFGFLSINLSHHYDTMKWSRF